MPREFFCARAGSIKEHQALRTVLGDCKCNGPSCPSRACNKDALIGNGKARALHTVDKTRAIKVFTEEGRVMLPTKDIDCTNAAGIDRQTVDQRSYRLLMRHRD